MISTAVLACSLLYAAVFTSAGSPADPETICRDVQTKYEKDLKENSCPDMTRDLLVKYRDVATAIRADAMKIFKVDVTLDPDTAHPSLRLSDDEKQLYRTDTGRPVPNNPERFDSRAAVLGRQGFSSGRFYYEVQVKDKTGWSLGVARRSINRKGSYPLSPKEGYWVIELDKAQYSALAGLQATLPPLPLSQKPQKVGVYVDYEQGEVSFYDVDHRSHIYSFTDQTFTGELSPYFHPGPQDGPHTDGANAAPLVITPVV